MKTPSTPTGLPNHTGGRKRSDVTHGVQLLGCCLLLLFRSGCASYGKVENVQTPDPVIPPQYSLRYFAAVAKESDLGITLTFSGGGTQILGSANFGVRVKIDPIFSQSSRSTVALTKMVFTLTLNIEELARHPTLEASWC